MAQVSELLRAIEEGQPQAADKLLPLVYDELRRLARLRLRREKPGQTLQATALVHEAYLRLVGPAGQGKGSRDSAVGQKPASAHRSSSFESPIACFSSRRHFFGAAAEAMRRILVEAARRKRRLKRGGGMERQALEEDAVAAPETNLDLLELDAALDKLAAKDPRKAELVKLRYFAGLTNEQAAEVLGISTTTADRDWSYARAWLFREISNTVQ